VIPQREQIKYLIVGWDDKVIESCDNRDEAVEKYFSNPQAARLTTSNDGADISQKGEPPPCEEDQRETEAALSGSEPISGLLEG